MGTKIVAMTVMSSIPKVSIIIPTFNRSLLLTEGLCSLQNQILQDWECIIVDDGSEDDTERIVSEFMIKDRRFRYYKRPHDYPKGACACRNYGYAKSSGKYIQWLDDDDILSEDKLQLQVEKLEKIGNPFIFTTCDWDLFWEGKKFERKNLIPTDATIDGRQLFERLIANQTFIPSLSYLMHRELAIKADVWNTNLSINQDAEYFTRVILASEGLINTPTCFVLYREHPGARISRSKDKEKLSSFLESLKLIKSHLGENHIENRAYFKWKLLKTFHQNWKANPIVLKGNYDFFKENGIDLNYAYLFRFRYFLYRKIYPWYKRLKNLKS